MPNDELLDTLDAATADASVELYEFRAPNRKPPISLEDRMIQAGVDAMLDYDSEELHSNAECVVRDIFRAMREVENPNQSD